MLQLALDQAEKNYTNKGWRGLQRQACKTSVTSQSMNATKHKTVKNENLLPCIDQQDVACCQWRPKSNHNFKDWDYEEHFEDQVASVELW